MHLELPWLDVTATGDADLERELKRATNKYAVATTTSRHAVALAMRRLSARELPNQPEVTESNVRFQFVRGLAAAARSTFRTADGSIATAEHATGRIDLALTEAVFTAPYSTWSDLVAAPLAEHWRALGCFPVHAAAVELDRRTILICGASGSGKTTTSLALVSAGGTWRADDKILLRRAADGLEAASLYANTNLAPDTVRHHPGLEFALERPPIDDTNDKRACRMHELGRPVDLSPFCPTVLLFPVRRESASSSWRPLDSHAAMMRLASQSPSSPVRDRLRAQHDLLVDLVRTCQAWRCSRDATRWSRRWRMRPACAGPSMNA